MSSSSSSPSPLLVASSSSLVLEHHEQKLMEQMDEWKQKGNTLFAATTSTTSTNAATLLEDAISAYSQGIVLCDKYRLEYNNNNNNNTSSSNNSSSCNSHFPLLAITLLSNRAMCYLKQYEVGGDKMGGKETSVSTTSSSSLLLSSNVLLQNCIDDCTKALDYQNEYGKNIVVSSTSSDTTTTTATTTDQAKQVRMKLLYRRAKAYFLQANVHGHGSVGGCMDRGIIIIQQQQQRPVSELLNDSAKDLLSLLSIEPTSKDGNTLLKMVRTQHKVYQADSTTPVAKTFFIIQDCIEKMKEQQQQPQQISSSSQETTTTTSQEQKQQQQKDPTTVNNHVVTCMNQMKIMLGLLDNDSTNVSMELGRLHAVPILIQAVTTLLNMNPSYSMTTTTNKVVHPYQLAVLIIRCLSQAGNYPIFVRTYLYQYQKALCTMIQVASNLLCTNIIQSSENDSDDNDSDDDTDSNIKYLVDCIVSLLSCWIRIMLHVDRDDINSDVISNSTKQEYDSIIQSIHYALQPGLVVQKHTDAPSYRGTCINTILRALLDLLGTWTCGSIDRDHMIRTALLSCTNPVLDPTVPVPKTQYEIHQMAPPQLASYRRRQNEIQQRNQYWSIQRCTILFDNKVIIQTNDKTTSSAESGGGNGGSSSSIFHQLVQITCSCYDHTIRREGTITIGKIIVSLKDDEMMKNKIRPYLHDINKISSSRELDGPMIEEILEGDEEEDNEVLTITNHEEEKVSHADHHHHHRISGITTLGTKMERALIVGAMLLTTKPEIGTWCFSGGSNEGGWIEASTELIDLIQSNDRRAMCLAAEVVATAATNEGVRFIVTSIVHAGDMEILLTHPDRDIRSSAAAAVAKISLAAQQQHKTKNEGGGTDDDMNNESELMSMLTGACELLMDQNEDMYDEQQQEEKYDKDHRVYHQNQNTKTKKGSTKGMNVHLHSHATSSVERGVEMITYLMSNTMIKEEICAGFAPTNMIQPTHNNSTSTSSNPSALELLVQVASTPGTGETLTGYGLACIFRNLSTTNEDLRKLMFENKEVTMEQYDELQRMQKTDEEKEFMDNHKDPDTYQLRDERIRKMASMNVPRALVQLTDNASEHTLEQIGFCTSQMSNDKSVRGTMIQQGVLSACIKVETKEGPTETETMKNVIRLCRHTISKLLITTNPSLLTSAQRLGSIKPLLRLIRDSKAKDLQHFEALLGLTNIASSGEDAKNRIITEKGIPALHYSMFEDHLLVRRAATEAMCNLIPHEKMLDHLLQVDHLRLWCAFAEDYEDDKYECSRAAAGCLAMATQQNVPLCHVLISLPRFEEQMIVMLESGRLEIMYRAFCILCNLVDLLPVDEDDTEDSKKVKQFIQEETKLIPFTRLYIENHLRNVQDNIDMEFPPEEKHLLPVVLELAKKIIRTTD